MRRGTEATVPIVPGLVNVMVAPAKSSGRSLLVETVRLALDLLERVGHDGQLLRRLHDREADQVRERDLLPSGAQLGVQLLAARVERLDYDVAERGGRRDGQGVRHVLDEAGCGARDGGEAGSRETGGGRCRLRGRR